MDRGPDWLAALERCCRQNNVPESKITALKSTQLLRQKLKPGPFMEAALTVLKTIQELSEFIAVHQEGYMGSGSYSESDKDEIESEVSAMVKACTASIDKLQQSVSMAAAPVAQAAGAAAPQGPGLLARQTINEQTTAHRHGVVLSLAERLGMVTSRFDRCRAARYQRMLSSARPQPPASPPPRTTHQHTSSAGSLGSLTANAASLTGAAGAAAAKGMKAAATALAGASGGKAADKVAQFGGAVFTRVKGMKEVVMGGNVTWSPADLAEHESQSGGAGAGGSGQDRQTAQRQEQIQLDEQSRDLLAQLTTTAFAVHNVERSVREVATLNQLFATAVHQQAAQIETIYEQAIAASLNIKKGNEEVRKTIEVNKSTQRYILALLVAATLGLLFFDWFNS